MKLGHNLSRKLVEELYSRRKERKIVVDWSFSVNSRTSRRKCSVKNVLRNFAKFTGKQLCQSLFFKKVAVLRPATLLKKKLSHRCFPVNFTKFLRARFSQNTFGQLLPKIVLVIYAIRLQLSFHVEDKAQYKLIDCFAISEICSQV